MCLLFLRKLSDMYTPLYLKGEDVQFPLQIVATEQYFFGQSGLQPQFQKELELLTLTQLPKIGLGHCNIMRFNKAFSTRKY